MQSQPGFLLFFHVLIPYSKETLVEHTSYVCAYAAILECLSPFGNSTQGPNQMVPPLPDSSG